MFPEESAEKKENVPRAAPGAPPKAAGRAPGAVPSLWGGSVDGVTGQGRARPWAGSTRGAGRTTEPQLPGVYGSLRGSSGGAA